MKQHRPKGRRASGAASQGFEGNGSPAVSASEKVDYQKHQEEQLREMFSYSTAATTSGSSSYNIGTAAIYRPIFASRRDATTSLSAVTRVDSPLPLLQEEQQELGRQVLGESGGLPEDSPSSDDSDCSLVAQPSSPLRGAAATIDYSLGDGAAAEGLANAVATAYDMPFKREDQEQQQHQVLEEGFYSCAEECASVGNRCEEETPVVVWGRCVSSDGWRRSSGSCTEFSSDGGGSEPAIFHPASHIGHEPASHAAEDELEQADAEAWIREAMRYMDLVVERCARNEVDRAPVAAAAAACNRSRRNRVPSCRSMELSQNEAASVAAGARRPRFKTATGDFALSRAALAAGAAADNANGVSMEHVHVLVLQLHKQLQQQSSIHQVQAEECGFSNSPCTGQHDQQESTTSAYDAGVEGGSGSNGSSGNYRSCSCCAAGPPQRISAALSHLYSENPDRFSELLHDSALLALLPLQNHAAAALADAICQHPSPLVRLLRDDGPSRLLEAIAEATAAEVLAAGAASSSGISGSRLQQQGVAMSKGEAAFAVAAKRYRNSSWHVGEKGQRHSFPGCLWRRSSREMALSYTCCGVPLCAHKRAAAKRFIDRQQQRLQQERVQREAAGRELLPKHPAPQEPLQKQLLQKNHQQAARMQQHQQRPLRQGFTSNKVSEEPTSPGKREDSEKGTVEKGPGASAAKTVAWSSAAAGAGALAREPGTSSKTSTSIGGTAACWRSPSACLGCARAQKQLLLFNSSTEPPLSLGQYVTRLQRLACVTEHEMLMALLLLTHAQQRQQQLRISNKNAHRLLLAALVLVSKVVRDDHTPLALWAVVGGVPPMELASLEMALLELVGHRISFSLPEFAAAYCLAAALSHLQRQQKEQDKKQQSTSIGEGGGHTQEGDVGETKQANTCGDKKIKRGSSASDEAKSGSNANNGSSRESSREETSASTRCTCPVVAVPRPALKTNPILRRLVQLQGVDASFM